MKIAARKSDLARLQAYEVGNALQAAHANLKIDYQFSSSLGDINLTDPLWKMPEKGVFTADLSEKLKRGECDIVVHSWKDLPTEPSPDTEIFATLPRADVRDVILFKRASLGKKHLTIYSSSPRRAFNLSAFLKWSLPNGMGRDVSFEPVRGNMATRAQKYLADQNVDGWVVAKAAFDRLLSSKNTEFAESQTILRSALEFSILQVVPITASPAAPAQGALAIEVRSDNAAAKKLLSAINHIETFRDVVAERELFRGYGGGCHQKIGMTYMTKPYGQIQVGRGIHEDKEFFFLRLVSEAAKIPTTKLEHVFQGEKPPKSDRKAFEIDLRALQNKDVFVARADAWPDGLQTDRVVWTSGLLTWRKLAEAGVWVTGSQDSLGEQEDIYLDALLGRKLDFVKLSHTRGYDGNPRLPVMATYEVFDSTSAVDLHNKTHFYWMSYSQFLHAIKLDVKVLDGFHACGPGNTFTQLSAFFKTRRGDASNLRIYLSREAWLKDILKH